MILFCFLSCCFCRFQLWSLLYWNLAALKTCNINSHIFRTRFIYFYEWLFVWLVYFDKDTNAWCWHVSSQVKCKNWNHSTLYMIVISRFRELFIKSVKPQFETCIQNCSNWIYISVIVRTLLLALFKLSLHIGVLTFSYIITVCLTEVKKKLE